MSLGVYKLLSFKEPSLLVVFFENLKISGQTLTTEEKNILTFFWKLEFTPRFRSLRQTLTAVKKTFLDFFGKLL